ncbi:MAG: hypothetical protein MRY49_00340 [Candidatus Pacebacteria bacterium]|nr:hypothetical protein [Candidatus Paceibacterota bacterium]
MKFRNGETPQRRFNRIYYSLIKGKNPLMYKENLAILNTLVWEHGEKIPVRRCYNDRYFEQKVIFLNAGKAYLIYCKILGGGLEKVTPSQRGVIRGLAEELAEEFRRKTWHSLHFG